MNMKYCSKNNVLLFTVLLGLNSLKAAGFVPSEQDILNGGGYDFYYHTNLLPDNYLNQLPDQYKFIQSPVLQREKIIAFGAAGHVFLIEDVNTREQVVAKFYHNNLQKTFGSSAKEECKREEEQARLWSQTFGNQLIAKCYNEVLIKSLVRGKTLQSWLTSESLFNKSESSKEVLNALKHLIKNLAQGGIIIFDLSTLNLMFDEVGKVWIIVDGTMYSGVSAFDSLTAHSKRWIDDERKEDETRYGVAYVSKAFKENILNTLQTLFDEVKNELSEKTEL